MEDEMNIILDEVLRKESVLKPEEIKELDKLAESKVLLELALLRDNISKLKDIIEKDMTPIAQSILDKVNISTYEYTEDEKQVVAEIEETMEFISNNINKFYQYDEEDLDKLTIK